MATWRNGSAFGFDCRRYQKVAGSSPVVVMFLSIQDRNINVLPYLFFFLVEVEGSGRLPLMGCSDLMLAYKYGRLAKWHRV